MVILKRDFVRPYFTMIYFYNICTTIVNFEGMVVTHGKYMYFGAWADWHHSYIIIYNRRFISHPEDFLDVKKDHVCLK